MPMSLENIKLPPITLAHLYKNSLIFIEPEQAKPTTNVLKYLGGNAKNIVLVIDNAETAFLPPEHLDFLLGILTACKLTMDDVALINMETQKPLHYHQIIETLNPSAILLFGVALSSLSLPFVIPDLQVQVFDQLKYLSAPSISQLQAQQDLKRNLWICLKKIFSV
ncbi:MAG: hypothetical protein ABJA57_02620 [Ginsengibacter sp.]